MNLKKIEGTSEFMNLGEMINPEIINKKFNAENIKQIDFHLINIEKNVYINLGDEVSEDEINNLEF